MKRLILSFFVLTAVSFAQTDVSGIISSNTTWTSANSPYVVTGNILVSEGVTLTIEAGVTVAFDSSKSFQISGELIAQGTSSNNIIFSSNQSNPAAGDWGNILFGSTSISAITDTDGNYISGSILNYCTVEYGGGINITGTTNNISPMIYNCTIENNGGTGIYLSRSSSIISNSIIQFNSGDGIYIEDYSDTNVKENIIRNNTGAGLQTGNYWVAIIEKNIIYGNLEGLNLSGLRSPTSIRSNKIIGNNGYGITIFPVGGTLEILNNIIADNSDRGINFYPWNDITNISVYDNHLINNGKNETTSYYESYNGNNGIDGGSYLKRNTFSLNNSTSEVLWINNAQSTEIDSCNFIGNGAPFLLKNTNSAGTTIYVENNYWGTIADSEIQENIYDWSDNSNYGIADYYPYLTAPNTDAPISPPTNLVKQTSGGSVLITWTANPESDVAGYKVHHGNFTGYGYSTSIDAGNVTSYTLTGVSVDSSISVTAYDSDADGTDDQVEGHESWFAVASPPPEPPTNLTSSYAGATSIDLSWTASTSDNISKYLIYRSTSANATTLVDSTSGAITYSDTALTHGLTYYYRVKAVDSDGIKSDYSNETSTLIATKIGVPTDYSSIQAGLTAAGTNDTVLVQPGTYTENIIWPETNGIKLISAGDSSNTIIDGGGVSSVITINPQTATIDTTTEIQGFKITNGGNIRLGGGMYLKNAHPLLKELNVTGNSAIPMGNTSSGGGIYILDSSPVIINSSINNNISSNNGGGVVIAEFNSNSEPIFNSCLISKNHASSGGGIYMNGTPNTTLINVTISSNNVNSNTAGMSSSGKTTFRNVRVINNIVNTWNNNNHHSGGIYFLFNSDLSGIENLIVAGNIAYEGGGIYYSGEGTLSNITIANNQSEYGALRIGGNTNILNVTIYGNQGMYAGIWNGYTGNNNSVGPNISHSNITNNGAGVYNTAQGIYADAINNYWGHSSGPYHPNQNPSGQGDSVNAFVNVDPWLTAPDTDAPPIPPKNVIVTGTGNDFISLKWDTSPLGDLAGYKLYYDSDSSGYPYANSVDIGTDTSYALSSLTLSTTYYLAVTTYDTDGNESWYSNEVTGTTRVLQTQSLDIGGDEDLQHMVSHTPSITFGYYDSMNETQTNYQIQVSTDSTFSSANMWDPGSISSDTTSVTYAGTTLVDGTTYYLRVRVASGDFWSDWSALSFRMNTEPTTPVLVSPINNQVSGTPVGLKVLNATDAEGDGITYSFNVYSDVALTTKLDSATAIAEGTDTTSWQITGSLPDNGQYFWTVSTNDGYEESAVSDAGSFLLNTDNNAPEAFTLSMPLVDTEVQNLSPVFSWHPANDPDPIDTVYYKLMLDTPDPGVVVFDVGTDTSFQVTNPLMDNTEYFWQVMAEDVIGFQTINEGGYKTFYTNVSNDPPSAVTLVAPLDGSIQTDLTPNFYWTEAVDPDPMDHVSYTMNWWPISMLPVIYNLNTDSTGISPDDDITDNVQFGWMVVANDMHDSQSSSDTSYFYSDAFPEPPLNFATVSPENNVEGLGTDVEFVWEEADDPDPIEEISYRVVYASDWEDSSTYVYSETIEDTSMGITLADNSQYYWLVEALDSDGFIVGSNDNTPNTIVVGTLSIDGDLMPVEFALHQNYPNPFNPVTTIRYDLPDNALVTITIYDMMGREVKTLVNQTQDAGYRSIVWDATNDYGKPVSAGIYLYQIQAGEYMQTKKMVLLK